LCVPSSLPLQLGYLLGIARQKSSQKVKTLRFFLSVYHVVSFKMSIPLSLFYLYLAQNSFLMTVVATMWEPCG
jgi:hypothetical protein